MTDKLAEVIAAHGLVPDWVCGGWDGCACDWEGDVKDHPGHVAAAIREAFKPAAYVNVVCPIEAAVDESQSLIYADLDEVRADAVHDRRKGLDWRVFALHEVPEGEAE